jgi:3,4-dihydroxy-2-butanone 4-phosphate synthase
MVEAVEIQEVGGIRGADRKVTKNSSVNISDKAKVTFEPPTHIKILAGEPLDERKVLLYANGTDPNGPLQHALA